jgi:branched-chain amino acid transport system permease protein
MSRLHDGTRWDRLGAAALILAASCAAIAPAAADRAASLPPASSWLFPATQLLALAALATAWGVIRTQLGRADLGHAVYVGIGAYTTGSVVHAPGWSMPVAVIAAALAAGAIGAAAGGAARRLSAPTFALVTLALLVACRELVRTATPLTGGPQGLVLPPVVSLPVLYQATLVIFLLTILGAVLSARRPVEPYVRPTRRRCTAVGALAGAASGSVGALWASQRLFIDADNAFSLARSFDVVWAASVGGLALFGPVLGAGLLIGLREVWPVGLLAWRPVVEAATLLLVVLHLPGGVTRLSGPPAREGLTGVD